MIAGPNNYGDGIALLRQQLETYELPEYGKSPRECVYQKDKVKLWRYCPEKTARQNDTATERQSVLIVYALVNRPWILDLQEQRSFIRRLLQEGLDVYLVDWGYPDEEESGYGMERYIVDYLGACANQVQQITEQDRVNLLGVCQGGTLSLCFAALFPAQVRTVTCMVAPVDFTTPDNLLSVWARHIDIDLLVNSFGNIPGSYLDTVFRGLKPFTNGARKYLHMMLNASRKKAVDSRLEHFIAMERWLMDTPDQPGEFFRQFVKWLYQENRLVLGELKLSNKPVLIENIDRPVLNIMASRDHLVPNSASCVLSDFIPPDNYSELLVDCGHIGVFVGEQPLSITPAHIADWLHSQN